MIPSIPIISGFEILPFIGKQWFTVFKPICLGIPPNPKTGKLRSLSYGSTTKPTLVKADSY